MTGNDLFIKQYLFDFSMVFGNEKEFLDKCVNSSNSDVSTAFPSLFSLLSSVLIESDVTIQNIGVESLCKLILLKIRQDSNVALFSDYIKLINYAVGFGRIAFSLFSPWNIKECQT